MRKARIARIAAVAAAIPMVMTISTGNASADAFGSQLTRGQQLTVGQYIYRYNPADSSNATGWELDMQADGNLVEYRFDNSTGNKYVCWASNTMNSGATHADYQADGNFVLYRAYGNAVWASNTMGGGGTTVDINSQGRIYVGTTPINWTC
ncbi:hypothetical protein [Streptacidiphilus sp. EB129]|jgi:hypothetical protein|uniref:hypothetical protein n=1 Tax=Streptacidiphilus sp. EB129 TaxID=3156262 RepID=UPI0035133E5E